jgi:3'-5' exonuclease
MNLEQLMIIDIETVPLHQNFETLDDRGKKLWQLKSDKYFSNQDKTPEEAYKERAGILAEFGKIICIGTGFFLIDNDGNLSFKQKTIYNHDEAALIKEFITICDKFITVRKDIQFVGHNIKEFDIPYICRRMLCNQITAPNYLDFQNKKPWETNIIDTLHWWRFGDYKSYTSLDLLTYVLNIPSSKTDMDGSMVSTVYYVENNLPKIADYCSKDIQVVAQLILRFLGKPLLPESAFISS